MGGRLVGFTEPACGESSLGRNRKVTPTSRTRSPMTCLRSNGSNRTTRSARSASPYHWSMSLCPRIFTPSSRIRPGHQLHAERHSRNSSSGCAFHRARSPPLPNATKAVASQRSSTANTAMRHPINTRAGRDRTFWKTRGSRQDTLEESKSAGRYPGRDSLECRVALPGGRRVDVDFIFPRFSPVQFASLKATGTDPGNVLAFRSCTSIISRQQDQVLVSP